MLSAANSLLTASCQQWIRYWQQAKLMIHVHYVSFIVQFTSVYTNIHYCRWVKSNTSFHLQEWLGLTQSMARHRKSPCSRRNLMVFDPLTPSKGHQFDRRVKIFSVTILVYSSFPLIWYAIWPSSENWILTSQHPQVPNPGAWPRGPNENPV